MAQGISLHVGVNSPFPGRFGDGVAFPLFGCDNAAKAMSGLASARGFSSMRTLLTRPETVRSALIDWFDQSARAAAAGDLVVFTFAGHGMIVPDRDGDEPAGDQALVCSDDLLVDDTIYQCLSAFRRGVRIVLVAECCYGGSIISLDDVSMHIEGYPLVRVRQLWMPLDARPKLAADVLLLAASSDTSPTQGAARVDGVPPFTQRLLDAWNRHNGQFAHGYEDLARESGGFLNTDLLNDQSVIQQQPFMI